MNNLYQRYIKRPVDIVAALVLLVVLAPVLLVTATAILLVDGWPVLFKQQRPGKGHAPFTLFKFRTMSHEPVESVELAPDEQRVTTLGRLLRRLSVDELPGLFNVVRGDMSLVGPRPLLLEYVDRYTPEQARRHDVRPGITGWAQVNGRNALTWDRKFELDVWYVDHVSFWLDIRILCKTVSSVIRREGISAAGHATMPRFLGSGKAPEGGRET